MAVVVQPKHVTSSGRKLAHSRALELAEFVELCQVGDRLACIFIVRCVKNANGEKLALGCQNGGGPAATLDIDDDADLVRDMNLGGPGRACALKGASAWVEAVPEIPQAWAGTETTADPPTPREWPRLGS